VSRGVKVFVIGAGQVGSTIVEALQDEHEVTVVDLDRARLNASRTATTSRRSRATGRAGSRSPRRESPAPTS
jgi:Trk K+ transport system NAD-binding subunit